MNLLVATYDKFYYVTDDPIFVNSINNGQSEPYPEDLSIVQKYLKMYPWNNRTYIDVGAHIGTTIAPYSRLFSKVIGYEPCDNNFIFLNVNLKINHIDNCQVHNIGIFNEEARVSVERHSDCNSGCFYIKKDINGPTLCRPLDKENHTSIDFIKIDVEGAELYVLQGAKNLLDQQKPLINIETNSLCETIYQINPLDATDFLLKQGYVLFANTNNPFYYHPQKNCHIENRTIFCFWTGTNPLTPNRQRCLENMSSVSGGRVILVDTHNLSDYILPAHPLHPAYQFLSQTHRADYLRTYFMHFHGGGYSDIKEQGGSWLPCFDTITKNDHIWVSGYKEIGPNGVSYQPVIDKWSQLVGNGAYICRPYTPLTHDWYTSMIDLMDIKLPELQAHPATSPQDCQETGSGYPLTWSEMLGHIFHRVAYQYKEHLDQSLPTPNFWNYR